MIYKAKYLQLVQQIKQEIPDFEVRWKDEKYKNEPWQTKLGLWFGRKFIKDFDNNYTTTFLPFVYFNSSPKNIDIGAWTGTIQYKY